MKSELSLEKKVISREYLQHYSLSLSLSLMRPFRKSNVKNHAWTWRLIQINMCVVLLDFHVHKLILRCDFKKKSAIVSLGRVHFSPSLNYKSNFDLCSCRTWNNFLGEKKCKNRIGAWETVKKTCFAPIYMRLIETENEEKKMCSPKLFLYLVSLLLKNVCFKIY